MRQVYAYARGQAGRQMVAPGARRRGHLALRAQAVPAQRRSRGCVQVIKCALELALAEKGPRTGEIRDQVELKGGPDGVSGDKLRVHGVYLERTRSKIKLPGRSAPPSPSVH